MNLLERDYSIDLLKIVACVSVVGLHTFQKDLSLLNATLYYLCCFAIPAFWMSSGAFLLNRGIVTWQYTLRKVSKIFRLILLWGLVIILLRLAASIFLHRGEAITPLLVIKEVLGGLVQKGTMWHFWYFGAMLIIYMFLPWITHLNSKQQLVLLFVAGGIGILLQVVSLLGGYPVQKYVIQTFRIWSWLFYLLLGGKLYHRAKTIGGGKNFERHKIPMLLLITLFTVTYENLIGRYVILENADTILHGEYFYDSIILISWVSAIFIITSRLCLNGKAKRRIKWISSLTTGVYILHPLILKTYHHFIPIDTVLLSLILFIVVLLLSALATLIFNRIPFLRFFIDLR